MVTLSPMTSVSDQRLMASVPQNSRRASLTRASSAKAAIRRSPSKVFDASMYSVIGLGRA